MQLSSAESGDSITQWNNCVALQLSDREIRKNEEKMNEREWPVQVHLCQTFI